MLREIYRIVATEGSMLYFICISINVIEHMYQYSLESFTQFFQKAIFRTTSKEEGRIKDLVLNIRYTIYQWICRGLFEKHKTMFMTLLTFRLMQKKMVKVNYSEQQMNFLLNCSPKPCESYPLKDWLPNTAWNAILRLGEIEPFQKLPDSIEKELPARFKDWFNELSPEDIKLPSDWRKLDQTLFQKLCVLRAMRPDRMSSSMQKFIKENLPNGAEFISMDQNFSF